MLEAGVKAPDYTLKDKEGNDISLSSIYNQYPTVVPVSYTHLDVYKRQTISRH